MLELSDRKWAEFKVGDILALKVAKSNDKGNLSVGDVPFIGRSNNNNGLQGFYDAPNITQGKCITLGMVGTFRAFWQENDFAASQNILTLRAPWLNQNTGLFLCNCIETAIAGKFSYGKSIKAGTFGDTILSLPINDAGQPDYDFMEQYIAERSPDYSWAKGCIEPDSEISLSDRDWGEFKLTDLFDIRAGKRIPSPDSGCTPYVTAGTSNNGVTDYISDKPNFKGNCITIGKVGCDAFYQPVDFCATNDVTILVPFSNQFNKFIGLFISNVINFGEKGKWNYGNQCRVNDCKRIVISLPIKADGTPDYDFMERYMKSLPFSKVLE